MQFAIPFITLTFAALAAVPVHAADCDNTGGVANGECVQYFNGNDCKGSALGSFKPTCEGNCFQFDSFNSLMVSGDGTFGTDCTIFSETNCQTEQTDSGNIVTGPGSCVNVPNAKSMKCFYRC